MLDISEVVEDTVRLLRSVVPPHRVAIVKSSVDGSAGQGGQGADHGDDGEGWNDFPPHDLSEIGRLTPKCLNSCLNQSLKYLHF